MFFPVLAMSANIKGAQNIHIQVFETETIISYCTNNHGAYVKIQDYGVIPSQPFFDLF